MKKTILAFLLAAPVTMMCLSGCKKPLPVVPDPIDDNYRVFYQIFVGSFSDSNGDGIGDLRGIINRLDYLNDGNINSDTSLGVQGIWLSPIFASPSYHKYDVLNYYRIDSRFGTEADLQELIKCCHERNIKLILDLAINHTSSDNVWFVNFRNAHKSGATDDPYYNYYTCVTDDSRVPGRTYYPLQGSPGEYYEGNFSSDMPELNYDNPEVRNEMVKVAKHYLDMGIDGFRFDAIKYIYFGDTSSSADFWNWYTEQLKKIKSDIYIVGECWSPDSEVMEYYPAMNCFNFTSAQLGQIYEAVKSGNATGFANYIESFQKDIQQKRPDAMYCPFIANHDTDRAAGFLPVSMNQMQMAANLYILCNGSPFIYYGEEIGMKGSRGSANTDSNRRLAMLWGDGDTVRNPIGSTYSSDKQTNGTVADQLKNQASLFHYYRRLIRIRNKYPEIARGNYTALDCQGQLGGFIVNYQNSTIGIFHNTSAEEVSIPLPPGAESFTSVCDYIGQNKASIKNNVLTIGPQTSAIVK